MSDLRRPDEIPSDPSPNIPVQPAGSQSDTPPPAMFTSRPPEGGGVPVAAWGVAGLVVLVLIAGLIFLGRRKAAPINTVQPLAAYAGNLPLTQLAMSESTSLSGGKSTFVDGHVQNTGSQTVTDITVQVLFHNDEAMPPKLETLPLALVRTRQPYVDTQPVSAAPLKPGEGQDFRLIFETIPENWNMQMPEIHIIAVTAK